jgi:hypothetical protein
MSRHLATVVRHPEAVFQIYTNGTLIMEQFADKLQDLGNATPLLSVNGFEEANDSIKGKGNFKTVVRAMELPGSPEVPSVPFPLVGKKCAPPQLQARKRQLP